MRTLNACSLYALLLAGLALPSQTGAAWMYVDAFKHSEPFFETGFEVNLADVPGVTGAWAVAADSTVVPLDPAGAGQYAAWLGPFATFTDFHDATVGNWRLTVEFGGGNEAVYDFIVNEYRPTFTADSFPPAPTMLSPLDGATGVDPTPTFTWDNGGTHDGPMESLFVFVWSEVNPAVLEFASSTSGPITLASESWTPSIVLPAGAASFLVQYETNENEDANVGDPVFNAGLSTVADPGINWLTTSGDLFSRDLIGFTVVPEPASALVFLAALSLSLARRRRNGSP